jgi:hypothetical protein
MQTLDTGRAVTRTEHSRAGPARGSGGRRSLGVALLVSAIAATLSGCVVAPGYVAPAPVVLAPAPVVVYPAPVAVYPVYRYHRGGPR